MTRRGVRPLVVLGVVMGVLGGSAPAAFAEPPPNDDIVNPTAIPEVPFAVGPIDTTEATGAIDDPQDCGPSFTSGTTWYAFTPTADITIEANTRGSDYDTTLGVFSGSPGALSVVACSDDGYGLQSGVRIDAVASTTYYFMVGCFCDGQGGATGGGTLFFNVFGEPFQPPLEMVMTIDPRGTLDPDTGSATITGTVTCNVETFFFEVTGQLRQRQGRDVIIHFDDGGSLPMCSPPGETATWSTSYGGGYRPGAAVVDVAGQACDAFGCVSAGASRKVTLRPTRYSDVGRA